MASETTDAIEIDEITALAIENIRAKLTEWGTTGEQFERIISQTIKDLQAKEHKQFHCGLKSLGEMLGFNAEVPNGTGDPDCVWSIGSDIHIVHEAKSDHTPNDPIGINDIRQAQSHEAWVREHCTCNKETQILPTIVSPRTIVDEKALVYANSLTHFLPTQMKVIFEEITNVIRRVRASAPSMSDEKIMERLYRDVKTEKLTPHDILKRLSTEPVKKMTSEKKTERMHCDQWKKD